MRYVAFLRAINVGGHTVKMDRLRVLFEELKVRNVETFIASGNVIFESTAAPANLETRIERHLEEALGYPVATFLRTPLELASILQFEPYRAIADVPTGHALNIGFLKAPPGKDAHAKVLGLCDEINELRVNSRELYWYARQRVSTLKITGATMERALKAPATFRNVTTVRKLAEKFA